MHTPTFFKPNFTHEQLQELTKAKQELEQLLESLNKVINLQTQRETKQCIK